MIYCLAALNIIPVQRTCIIILRIFLGNLIEDKTNATSLVEDQLETDLFFLNLYDTQIDL